MEVVPKVLRTACSAMSIEQTKVGHFFCLIGPTEMRRLPEIGHNSHIILIVTSHQAVVGIRSISKNLAASSLRYAGRLNEGKIVIHWP